MLDEPTELTIADIESFVKKIEGGFYDIKEKPCFSCSKMHFPNYGHNLQECDECFFARWPEEERKAFYRSFF